MPKLKSIQSVAIAFILSTIGMGLNTPEATANTNNRHSDKTFTEISNLNDQENQSLSLHLLLANSFKHQTQSIDLQDNFELSDLEQTIPLRDRTIVASTFGGKASWYGPGFHGRLTANGERYNQNAMTAAHKSLRFGTRVKVTNLNNGRSVIVRINDRGPFIKGRVIDLSAAAARSLNMIHSGVAPVKVTILGR